MSSGSSVANLKVANNTRATNLIFNDKQAVGKWKISAVTNATTNKRELIFQLKKNGEWVTGTKFIAPART